MYKGAIWDFPTEIVEKMLYYQEQQGNKRDVSVFEKSKKDTKGFNWIGSPEGYSFWDDVIWHRKFDLFFEKYPKQNVVGRVQLEQHNYYKSTQTNGDWHIIKVQSTTSTLDGYDAVCFCLNSTRMYLPKCHVSNRDWQPASQPDIDWLDNCIKADKYVEMKKYEFEVVHCATQEQWDFVSEKLDHVWSKFIEWRKDWCININLDEVKCASSQFFKSQNSLIHSFEDWCEKFDHKFMDPCISSIESDNACENIKVGDWVIWYTPGKYFKGASVWNKGAVGKIDTIIDTRFTFKTGEYIGADKKIGRTPGNCYKECFRKALPHEIPNNIDYNSTNYSDSNTEDTFVKQQVKQEYRVEDGYLPYPESVVNLSSILSLLNNQ